MKIRFTLFLILFFNFAYSQKEGNNWYFGHYAALNFNNGFPVPLTNSMMEAFYGCSTISDKKGNLLFYSNGKAIWNRNHDTLKNGFNLNGSPASTQSGVIVPLPGSDHIYYIFTIGGGATSSGLNYSVIDMNFDSGLGAVISKNNQLVKPTTEKITAIRHSNNSSVWIITHEFKTNAFYAYLLSNSGLSSSPVISNSGRVHGPNNILYGYMKASPDGKKLAAAVSSAFTQLFDFNTTTGVVSNSINLTYKSKDINGYGIEFSPNGRLLYVTDAFDIDSTRIFQFDIQKRDSTFINNSCNVVAICPSISYVFMALQLGMDKKIYIVRYSYSYLDVIVKPDKKGNNCNYLKDALYLNGKSSIKGLPTFLQSYFFVPDFTAKSLCFGDSTQFSITDTNQFDSLIWNFVNTASGINNISKLLKPVHRFTDTGNYRVELVVYNKGATDTTFRDIFISYPPRVTFTVNDSLQCLRSNLFSFTNNSTIKSGSMTWEWDFGDSIKDFSKDVSHFYLKDSSYKVRLVALSDYGCTDTFIRFVSILNNPTASFEIVDTIQCLNINRFNCINKSKGATKFRWDFGDGSTDTNFNSYHSYTTAGQFKVELQAITINGCFDSITKTMEVLSSPNALFSINDSSQCLANNNFQFNNKTTGTNSYLWDFGDGSTDTTSNTNHKFTTTGNYTIKLVVVNNSNCTDSLQKIISVFPQPKGSYYVNDSIQCLNGNSFTFTNKSSSANSYHWDFGDGNSDTKQNAVHKYTTPGNYTTNLIAKSVAGCSDTVTLPITILVVPMAAFSVNDTSQILPGNSFVFSNLTNCKPATSVCKYLWDFGDSQNDTLNNPTHSYSAIGMYHVLLTATSTNGCKDTISLNVYVTNIIVITAFTVNDVCLGDLAYFKNSSSIQFDSFLNFMWDFGDGNTIIRPNPQHLYADTGTYKVQLVSLSYGGFRDTANGKVRVLPSPTVEIIATPDSILEQGIKATLSTNGNYDSLLWSTGAITASIIIEKSGIYCLRVVDFNGCDAFDSITIEYIPEKPFGAMNVITPNGDGINDLWKIDNVEKYQPCELAIFNRWGDELYSTNNYNNNWDGKYKGKSLPEGTYYFVLVAKDGKVFKGAVNILR